MSSRSRGRGRAHSRQRGGRPAPGAGSCVDITDVVIGTNPGCDDPRHRLEVFGAMQALAMGHRWWDETIMDCGCVLTLLPVE